MYHNNAEKLERGRCIKMRLDGKVALITGAAGGQGKEEAFLFAKEGAIVVITDIQKELLEKTGEELMRLSPKSSFFHHDVSSEEQWQHIVAQVVEKYGRIDVLVNNAGISPDTRLLDTSMDLWNKVMAINVTGTFLGMKTVVPVMKENGGGSIINISSIAGLTGGSGASAYTASKGAVRMLTKGAAIEYAKDSIRVNSVHPGVIETPMTEELLKNEQVKSMLEATTPIPRFGKPIDVAYGVLYLASDESSFVTGIELPVDGGYVAQ